MDNYEKLRESKIVYEYINDLLENGNFEMREEYSEALKTTMGVMADIYTNTHILMKDNKEERGLLNTELNCPCCSRDVIISDLITYGYLCEGCDENYYLCEGDLNYEWYFRDKNKDKLKEDVLLELSYSKDEGNVVIGTESSSGAKYKCNSVSDLANAVECYAKSYLTYDNNETYYIEVWLTENDREQGNGFRYSDVYTDKEKAIEAAKELIDTNGYSFVEVVKENPKVSVFCTDGETEELISYDKYYNKIYKVSHEELNEYIENWTNKEEQKFDYDLLYCEDNGSYIAVDNYEGECYVEEFETEAQAVFWLNTNIPAEQIQFNVISKDIIEKVYDKVKVGVKEGESTNEM